MEKKEQSTTSSKRRVKSGAKKGKQFEREIANELGHIFEAAKRHLEYQADEAQEGVDLEGTEPFKFQMKNHQNYVSVGTINEIRIKDPNHIPVLVTKGNRMETMAVLPFAKFVTLLEVAYGLLPLLNEKPKQLRIEKAEVIQKAYIDMAVCGESIINVDDLI